MKHAKFYFSFIMMSVVPLCMPLNSLAKSMSISFIMYHIRAHTNWQKKWEHRIYSAHQTVGTSCSISRCSESGRKINNVEYNFIDHDRINLKECTNIKRPTNRPKHKIVFIYIRRHMVKHKISMLKTKKKEGKNKKSFYTRN